MATTPTCGTGGYSGPKPGDPDNNLILTATPAFGGIDLSWTYPSINPHAVAFVIIYRALINDFSAAIYHRKWVGDYYFDRTDVPIPTEYFYWIQVVSINGTVGDLIGPASARARPTIEQTLEMLSGQIADGALSQSLKQTLDQISILNQNLLNEIMAREDNTVSLAQAIQAAKDESAQALTFVNQEINSRATSEAAIVEQINTVAATLDNQFGAVTQNMQVSIDGITNHLTSSYTLKTMANGLIGGFGVLNNGEMVEIGFAADRFWIGGSYEETLEDGSVVTNQTPTRLPFIVENGEVFMDEAVVNQLTFNKLRSANGSFIVEGDQIKGVYLNVKGINVTRVIDGEKKASFSIDEAGNAYFAGALEGATGTFNGQLAAGILNAAAFNGISWPTFSQAGTYNLTVPELPEGWTAMACRASLQGAGGGGGGSSGSGGPNANPQIGGGGGGAGTFYSEEFPVTPGAPITLIVGAKGLGGAATTSPAYETANDGTPGGFSQLITGNKIITAPGGTEGGGSNCGWRSPYVRGRAGYLGGGQSDLYSMESAPGGVGGSSRFGAGGSALGGNNGSYGNVPTNAHAPTSSSGAGGAGGSTWNVNSDVVYCYSGGNGADGRIQLEFYDPNFVVLNARYKNLINWLDEQGHGPVPDNAR